MIQPSKLTDQENCSIPYSFGLSCQDQSTKNNKERVLTRIFKRCNGNKSSTHPIAHEMTPAEFVARKLYLIELKYFCLYLLIDSQSDSLYVEMLT